MEHNPNRICDSNCRSAGISDSQAVTNQLVAYVSNYLIGGGSGDSWRFMLGVEAVPALLFTILVVFVPNSPRWLITKRGRIEDAKAVLRIIDPNNVDAAVATIQAGHQEHQSGFKQFISGRYNFPIILAFLFAFFNQLSGINAVIYYAPRIFNMTGMGESTALLSSAGIGVVNLIFTIAGMFAIDRYGRRFLMYIGSVGYIVSLSVVAFAFYTEAFSGYIVPAFLFVFIASHAIGQGAVIWVFISEIFPNDVRSYGMSLGSSTHWVFAALIAGIFPFFAGALGAAPIFAFFAFMMVFQLLYVWKMMPETKGVSLEELETQLVKTP